ncbi:carbon-nitrogen family hydrolase [Aquibacillus salsiterrae]|uniref:Carbon-nitrogen family hydrolase n=1 Tax=Aquibacillus salsiterrae TaxID=2950439 RepID=A0A9X3WBB0_9BACI|nr:carbon-nitrogen family hydrolase [Aquibacillus salsiterrae]MDC3415962.1 carbon-nitrogen family hydrolase [Aquibacillus salsiterrae]
MGLKVALCQIDIAFGDPKANFKKVEAFFQQIEKDVDIVVLPELWTTGYDLTRLDEIADQDGQASFAYISQLAKKYQVHVVAGSIAKRLSDTDVTNTLFVVNREGKVVKEYSKAHLFRLMDEEKHLIEGNDNGLFELENTLSAGVICYDIRFPEWIRTQMLADTKVLYVVAEWPKPRIDHWRALLISRAIENQCYVVACNRVGADPNNEFGGHSIIVGPWGEIIAEANDEETILYGEIEPDKVDEVRSTIPIFTDRRPDIYKLS